MRQLTTGIYAGIYAGIYDIERGDKVIPAELRRVKKLRLRIWNVNFKGFESLAEFPNTAELEVMNYPLDSLAPLSSLLNLRLLELCHFPKARSLEPLAGLIRLEKLTLKTLASWDGSGKRHVVESFRPLGRIKTLRSLVFTGVVPKDQDLSPLHGLTKLRELGIPNLYKQEQLAVLARKFPKIRRGFLLPYDSMNSSCKKCQTTLVMLSGSDLRPQVICPTCHQQYFERCVARFEAVRLGKKTR